MESQFKQYLILILLLLLLMLPNTIFVFIGEDSAVFTMMKQFVFLAYTFALLILPLSFLKPKIFFSILVLFFPFAFIDIYVLFLTGTQTTSMHYMTTLGTNLYEAKELLSGSVGFATLLAIYGIIYIYLLIKLSYKTVIFKKHKEYILIFSITLTSILFARDFYVAYDQKPVLEIFNRSLGFFEIKLDKTFPLGSINKIFKVLEGNREVDSFIENNKNFSYKDEIIEDLDRTIVLVIGESARKYNFQLYGYDRENNPNLSSIDNVIVFPNVYTNANFTQTSFPQIVTSVTPSTYSKRFDELGIVSAFKDAGYHTYWITNQPYYPNSLYYMYSIQSDYYKDVSTTFEMKSYDTKTLPFVKDIIRDEYKKRLIVIHTIGSHYRYNLRYPKEYSKYLPQLDGSISISGNSPDHRKKYINSFDNSILFTDYFLSEIIKQLSSIKEESLLLYLSDHGENLYDDDKNLFLHGTATPSKYELEIPFILWYSDNFDSTKVAVLQNNIDKKFSSEVVFNTLTSIGGFKTKFYDAKLDILSDSLRSGDRVFLKADGTLMEVN